MQKAIIKRIAGACGIASQITGLAFLLGTISISPWFSWTENHLSVLGVEGSATALFNLGLILTGTLSLVFGTGLGSHLRNRLGRLGVVILILGSASFGLMGIFPRTTGLPHNLASLGFFVFISSAIFIIGIEEINTPRRIWGLSSLAAAFLIVIFQLVPSPWDGSAILQLLSCLPWSLWTTLYSIRLLKGP